MAKRRIGCSGAFVVGWLSFCAAVALLDPTSQETTWTALGVGGVVLFGLFRLQRGSPANAGRGPVAVLENHPDRYAWEVVGESHYQDNLKAAYGRRSEYGEGRKVTAHLVLEDDNPHDRNAVRVEVDGRTVGYLPKEVAPEWRRAVKDAGVSEGFRVEVPAKIRGGWDRGRQDRGNFGIWLDLPISA